MDPSPNQQLLELQDIKYNLRLYSCQLATAVVDRGRTPGNTAHCETLLASILFHVLAFDNDLPSLQSICDHCCELYNAKDNK